MITENKEQAIIDLYMYIIDSYIDICIVKTRKAMHRDIEKGKVDSAKILEFFPNDSIIRDYIKRVKECKQWMNWLN